MSRVADVCRVVVGIVTGLVCGQAANRFIEPSAQNDSPLEISEQHRAEVEEVSPATLSNQSLLEEHIAPDVGTAFANTAKTKLVSWTAPLNAADDSQFTPESESNSKSEGDDEQVASLGDQLELAAEEMRDLDRLALPERRDVAWRLHSRLCQIGRELDEQRNTYVVPNDVITSKWDGRPDELTNHRAIVRSLLAAIAVAPEKAAFMSKASQQRIEAEDKNESTNLVVVGDLMVIKKTDRAWFFQISDPYNPSRQHMVRVDCHRLEQRIPVGSRVVALGRTVPTTSETIDTPIVATEVYAVKN